MEKCRHCSPGMEKSVASSKAGHRRKKSLWNWATIRAFAKIRRQQFYCVFSIFVQTIDGLPSYMDGLRLVVQLDRKSKRWQTMPSRVFQHIVEFDETLHIDTTIFGRETNMQDNTMKFFPKDYILSVVAVDAEEHFLFNRHCIDLSRLLPAYVEAFWEPNKPMSSTASFKLGGKAEGAVLVATFDFEVLNEELRRPISLLDGNASARFGGSSLRRVSRAVKSLPNSPNPSPFARRANHHFTSPCCSDPDSTADSTCIGKFDLDSSAKETEEWSVYDYSSSDEERFQALKNDPLSLDACCVDAESVTFSPAIRVKEELGSLDDLNTQVHLANVECVEKVEIPSVHSLGMDAPCHQIDVRMLLNGHEPERKGSITSCGNKEMAKFEVLERNPQDNEVAADKFCINIKIVTPVPTANVPMIGANDKVSSDTRVEGQCFSILSSSCVKSKSLDSNGGVFVPDEVELFSEVDERHWLVEGDQPFFLEKVDCTSAYCHNESRVCMDVQTQSNGGVPVGHFWEDAGHESGSENLLDISVEELDLSPSSPRNEDANIFQFSAEDEISLEASAVVEDFFDLLEREEKSTFTGPNSPTVGAIEVSDKQVLYSCECLPSSVVQEEGFSATSLKLGELCPTTEIPQESIFTRVKQVRSFSKDDLLDTNYEDVGLFSIIEAAELEMRKAAQSLRSKERAKILEDAETKALMKEWGLSDKSFERPSRNLLPCSASEMPNLSDSASVIVLNDGSCLRAMSGCHSYSNLMMQVSKPVVIPAGASLCAIDLLSSIASQGLEDLTVQAFMKMPLGDLAGSSMDHPVRGVGPNACYPSLWQGSYPGRIVESPAVLNSSTTTCTMYKPLKVETLAEKVVSFEDLTLVALHTIEPLAMEGLKLQCSLSKEAPCNVSLKSSAMQNNMSNQVAKDCIQGKSFVFGKRLPDTSSLLGIAISMDEWLQVFEHVNKTEDKLAVTVEASEKEQSSKFEDIPGWPIWAHHSNSFTVAMRVQLRDPQRYYEPVGASMMALVQVETLKEASNLLEDGSGSNGGMVPFLEACSGVQLKLMGVHISGVEQSDKCGSKGWGSKQQLQSASRWLMANFKANNLRHMMSQASTPSEADSKHVKREVIWSISACEHMREAEGFWPCIRNPDITFVADGAL